MISAAWCAMAQIEEYGSRAFAAKQILVEKPVCRGCYTVVKVTITLSVL